MLPLESRGVLFFPTPHPAFLFFSRTFGAFSDPSLCKPYALSFDPLCQFPLFSLLLSPSFVEEGRNPWNGLFCSLDSFNSPFCDPFPSLLKTVGQPWYLAPEVLFLVCLSGRVASPRQQKNGSAGSTSPLGRPITADMASFFLKLCSDSRNIYF